MFIFEFIKIIIFIFLSFGLSFLLLIIGLNISPKAVDFEKLSAYECGFTPIGDARQPFHVRFYVVGILFLLFDLEVIFLFPWALTLNNINHSFIAFFNVMFFLFLLIIGFLYEFEKGSLDWE
jgi:NADH-quinone oxidoreductase subunit A